MNAGSDHADWTEAFAAFDRWDALDDAARVEWAAELAASRPALHARLQSLISADAEAEGAAFLEPAAEASMRPFVASLEGQQLGPWRIESLIGTGGMGQVWRAERTDGRYDGHAAIKLMRLASADAGANERFAREGRFLGRLNHPNIARLLDAGTTAGGERYLVLEHVEGERIDRWCDSHALDTEARLRLFVTVCEAVAHAHANLVVHRDLKPSNIFVAGSGEVKLLDFGVAKLLEGETGEVTELTREAGTALTPHYAAPEQLAGNAVSTATDVYGLGMVLRTLMPPAALRGDLAVVAGKATKAEPRERYATVPEFADDLRRILDRRPVKARPDSLAYRTRRYVQRHAFGVGAAALIVLAIGAGFAATLVKQHEAERQAARAVAVKRFLLDLFEQARGSVHTEGTATREATVNDLLAAGAKRVETALVGQPEIRDEVFQILIELYSDTGDPKQIAALAKRRLDDAHAAFGAEDVRSVPAEVTMAAVLINNGETPEVAKAWLAHAEALLDRAGDRTSLWRARELRWRGLLAMQTHENVSWEDHPLRRAMVLMRAEHPDEGDEMLATMTEMPRLACRYGRSDEAMADAEELQRRAVVRYGADNLYVDFASYLRGQLLLLGGRPAEAVPPLQQAIAGFRRHVGDKSPNIVVGFSTLAEAHLAAGHAAESDAAYAAARRAMERDHAGDQRLAAQLAVTDRNLADIRAGKPHRCGDAMKKRPG